LEIVSTRIESVHKNLEKQMSQDRETLTNKILEFTVQYGHLKEKVKDIENILNPFPKKIFSIDVRIEELARYFGLKFTKADVLEIVMPEMPGNLSPGRDTTRLQVEPYLSSLIADFKNITNKIPYYQKKVGQLQRYYDALPDKERGSRPQIIIQREDDPNPQFVIKPSSKNVPAEGNDDTILTADDVNTNLLTIRTEMMSEIEKMHGSLLKTNRAIEDAQKNLLQKVFEFERKLNSQPTHAPLDITSFKHTIDVLQENFNKLKASVRTDNTEMDKYHVQNLNLYNDKLENVQNDLRIIKKQQLNMMLLTQPAIDGGVQDQNINHSENNKSQDTKPLAMQHLLKRLDIVELIADDYLELHVEREVMKCQQKLINAAFNLEEKITGYCYILQHYRVVNGSLMNAAFVKLNEAFRANKNTSHLKTLKKDCFPPLYPLIKNVYDSLFPNFPILIDSALHFLVEDENLSMLVDDNGLFILLEHLENTPRIDVQVALIKMFAHLCQFGTFLIKRK